MHIHREREMHLVLPLKDPRYISGNKLAQKLGLKDSRKVNTWIRNGLLEGESVPYRDHDVTRVLKSSVVEWVQKPTSWLYFRPERISDPNLKLLVEHARKAWGDEWWSTRRVVDYWGWPDTRDIQRAIKFGRVKTAVRIINLSGRHKTPRWSFWFMLKSEVVSWDLQAVLRFRKDRRG